MMDIPQKYNSTIKVGIMKFAGGTKPFHLKLQKMYTVLIEDFKRENSYHSKYFILL